MRRIYRLITLSAFLFSTSANAVTLFVEAIDWRATETNDWCYVNSETLPNQAIMYKSIDFNYSPGFRIGLSYQNTFDALLAYTRLYTTANDSTSGNIQPSFLGSVNAKPSAAYLYSSGSVNQSIDYNIFDLNVGKSFHPANSFLLHPIVGLMGGWINQSFNLKFHGSTSTNENVSNNFSGIGPKVGVDTGIPLFNYHDYQPQLIAAFATSYLLGHWNISDVTHVTPTKMIYIQGSSHSMGALTLQGSLGLKVEHQRMALKLAYEISDWFDQSQFFDNDTGAHNNDLILQGLTLGLSYDFA